MRKFRPTAWLLWLLELALTALGGVWLFRFWGTGVGIGIEPLIVWDVLALAYVVTGWVMLRQSLPQLSEIVGPRWYAGVFALVASLSGLTGGVLILALKKEPDPIWQITSVVTVLLSWLLLHTAYARLYARVFFAEGGLRFPQCKSPQLAEFVYFSFCVGTSFATSDVSVTASAMRRRVTAHSVLSFFFNAAVVAIAIDFIKS